MMLYISMLPLGGGLLKHHSVSNTSFERLARAAGQEGALAVPPHVCSAFQRTEHRMHAGGRGPFYVSVSDPYSDRSGKQPFTSEHLLKILFSNYFQKQASAGQQILFK